MNEMEGGREGGRDDGSERGSKGAREGLSVGGRPTPPFELHSFRSLWWRFCGCSCCGSVVFTTDIGCEPGFEWPGESGGNLKDMGAVAGVGQNTWVIPARKACDSMATRMIAEVGKSHGGAGNNTI